MEFINAQLHTPYTWLIAGPSKSGKTNFVNNLLKYYDLLFPNRPDYVRLYYSNMQSSYTQMLDKKYVNEMINLNDSDIDLFELEQSLLPHKHNKGSLVIFDDALFKVNDKFAQIFTRLGHHTNTSLIFITQSFFYDDKNYRIIALQQDYVTLMTSKHTNQNQLRNIARQLCPGNYQRLVDFYHDAGKDEYGHLFIDSSGLSNKEIVFRSRMFPHEIPHVVYNM